MGDVKNEQRVKEIIMRHNIDTIYHAAAYKHVPIVENFENISEGIRNNIFGTKVICDVSDECKVKKVVVISTDKAVRPTNIMGASKRLAEMLVQSKNLESKNTNFCMVRFGNVINSSGSVIPLFRHQKLITLRIIFHQVKILDLAKKLIYLSGRNIASDTNGEGIHIKEVGLRPGEKLYEELLISGEEIKTPNNKIFKSNENFPSKDVLKKVVDDLKQTINNNNIIGIKNILKTHIEGFKEVNHERIYNRM